MNRRMFSGLVVALAAGALECAAQGMPAPGKEQEWLEQFVGEWEWEAEVTAEPDQQAKRFAGVNKIDSGIRVTYVSIGELDAATNRIKPPAQPEAVDKVEPGISFAYYSRQKNSPVAGLFTLQYDLSKKQFRGRWGGSLNGNHWQYDGTLDPVSKILTLNSFERSPLRRGQWTKFKGLIEFKDNDHIVATFSLQDLEEDVKWVQLLTVSLNRKQ